MTEIFENIECILLIIVLLLNLILIISALYTDYKSYQNDKKFWKKQEEVSEKFLKRLEMENTKKGTLENGEKNSNQN